MRDALATLDCSVRSIQRRSLLRRNRFPFDWRGGKGTRHGIGHDFEQSDDRFELPRPELVEQLVSVPIVACTYRHP